LSTKYLLPCSCGLEIAVEPAQAGQKVHCICGSQVQVPTMREITRLERFEAEPAVSSAKTLWGLRHGLLVLGVLMLVAALAGAAHAFRQRPKPPVLDALSLQQTWMLWQELRQGVDRPLLPHQEMYNQQMRRFHVLTGAMALVGGLGVVCVAVSLLMSRQPHRMRDTKTASSVSSTGETSDTVDGEGP
jgi:hypothetical protein